MIAPTIAHAAELPALMPVPAHVERVDLLVLLADARAIVGQLQGELAQLRSDHAYTLESMAVLQDTLLARTTTLHLLEAQLAAFAPLVNVWTEVMRGKRAFAPLSEWVRFEVAGPMRGHTYEDPGAVADSLQDRSDE